MAEVTYNNTCDKCSSVWLTTLVHRIDANYEWTMFPESLTSTKTEMFLVLAQ